MGRIARPDPAGRHGGKTRNCGSPTAKPRSGGGLVPPLCLPARRCPRHRVILTRTSGGPPLESDRADLRGRGGYSNWHTTWRGGAGLAKTTPGSCLAPSPGRGACVNNKAAACSWS